VTDATDRANYCYRHPKRQSYVLCQRCGRTICSECQTQAAVGVHCPECVKEARQNSPRRTPAVVRMARASSNLPIATYSLIGVTAVVFVLQLVSNGSVTNNFAYFPSLTAVQPWQMLTNIFLHTSPLHILLNMYSLFVIGPLMERAVGRGRFLAIYFIAGFGGSVGVLLLTADIHVPGAAVLGASGAIFGLLGGLFVIQRRLGGNTTQLFIVIAINLVIGFVIPGLAWQAHVAGLLVGAAVGFIYLETRRPNQKVLQIALVALVAIALIVTTALRVVVF
jgi:membrane associated rhomboid family serine protease